jgi:diguanylate cyclase (GGDEF)-like protein
MPDKILIVDDSVENRQLLLRALARANYEIVEAADGREGLSRAVELLPELILLDIVMPELDGYQVCAALKKDRRTTDIPVIFLSAKTETKDKIKGLEIGGVDYITKPFDRGEVLARVRTQLKIRHLTQELRDTNAELHKKNTELEEANAAITRLMRTDALTGLANRRYFLEVLENIMSLARRHRTPLTLIMADLDHFKAINDAYGHACGDQVLQDFGVLLKKYSRRGDLAARFGGEEFIVALPLTDLSGAKIVAEKFRLGLEEMKWGQIKTKVTASFGISLFQPEDTPESFIERADQALYQAKAAGRNRVMGGRGFYRSNKVSQLLQRVRDLSRKGA